jgi:Na+/H+ antiporter NhaD/arsenite permease-like protein
MISLFTLLAVFVLIAIRQIGRFRLQIWQIMLVGAVVVLGTGQISPPEALRAIDPDVMLFLFGMFIVGQAMEDSGFLSHISFKLFGRVRSVSGLLLLILFSVGLLSSILLNDTLAIIGTPVMLQIARKTGIKPKILLLTLAFSVTIGSVMSPIGNPQNLLIAIHGGIANPFITFLRFLAIPTIINLLLTYVLLRVFYRRQLSSETMNYPAEPIKDARLASLSRISLFIIAGMVLAKICLVLAGLNFDFRLTYIALAGALPIVLFSPHRAHILLRIDWFTLIFFASMFVLTMSVWESGLLQSAASDLRLNLASSAVILTLSVILSQFISNVPLVAIYLPVLDNLGTTTVGLMALAAGSTIAGNLSILGAASNVIIIQNAEKRGGQTITFWDFVKVGLPLTAVNLAVYWLFLTL